MLAVMEHHTFANGCISSASVALIITSIAIILRFRRHQRWTFLIPSLEDDKHAHLTDSNTPPAAVTPCNLPACETHLRHRNHLVRFDSHVRVADGELAVCGHVAGRGDACSAC